MHGSAAARSRRRASGHAATVSHMPTRRHCGGRSSSQRAIAAVFDYCIQLALFVYSCMHVLLYIRINDSVSIHHLV